MAEKMIVEVNKMCKKWMTKGCKGCDKVKSCPVVENFKLCAALRRVK